MANFATFVSKTLIFSVPKIDEFNFKPAQCCINKIFELFEPSPVFGRFQMDVKKW